MEDIRYPPKYAIAYVFPNHELRSFGINYYKQDRIFGSIVTGYISAGRTSNCNGFFFFKKIWSFQNTYFQNVNPGSVLILNGTPDFNVTISFFVFQITLTNRVFFFFKNSTIQRRLKNMIFLKKF